MTRSRLLRSIQLGLLVLSIPVSPKPGEATR
jgi:hypothetical protein